MTHKELAKVCKALADPKRLQILSMLSQQPLCACKILEAFSITQPTLSHDMKLLCGAGLAIPEKRGRWTHYTLNRDTLHSVRQAIDGLMDALDSAACPAGPEAPAPGTTLKGDPAMQTEHSTKLYVLTGFLGAGKTTLLLRLLDALQGRRIGVIQNEFGKLGIDGAILRNDNIQMVEVNRGSIFCSCLKLQFVQALAEMAAQNLEYLFVESSGLGDPSNVEEILQAAQVAAGASYEFRGVICLVDAVNFLEQRGDLETVNRQLKHCHLAVITKTDLVSPAQLEEVVRAIREINPVCPIEQSQMGSLSPQFLQDDLLLYQWAEGEETTNSAETKPKTLFMDFSGTVTREQLTAFLREIQSDLYRCKGFFHLADEGWNQVDLVGSRIDWKPCEEKELSQLVFISRIGPAVIKHIFSAWETCVGQEMKLRN